MLIAQLNEFRKILHYLNICPHLLNFGAKDICFTINQLAPIFHFITPYGPAVCATIPRQSNLRPRMGEKRAASLIWKKVQNGLISIFNRWFCVFHFFGGNNQTVKKKRESLKNQGFLPQNADRRIGQSKPTDLIHTPAICRMTRVKLWDLSGGKKVKRSSATAGSI